MNAEKLKADLEKHKKSKSTSTRVDDIKELIGSDGENDVVGLINSAKEQGRFISLPTETFRPDPNQPRKTFDPEALKRLQVEIEAIGQLQPIVVRPMGDDGTHMIIAGERRWRAISASKKVPSLDAVIITSELDELLVLRMQIQENDNRESVNALEGAASIMRGVNLCKAQDKSIEDKAAAKLLGISATSISKSRSILNASAEIKALSEDNVTQDTDTLYELSKAHKKNSAATEAFIEDIRSNDIEGNVRKAAKRLDADLKVEKQQEKENSNNNKKKTPKTKNDSGKAKDQMLEVLGVTFGSDGDKTVISLMVGKTNQSFVLSDTAIESLTNKFNLESES
jgi:ParB family chromosome partitioning protein